MPERSLHTVTGLLTRRKLPYSFPRGVIVPDEGGGWRMTPVVIHLMSTVTGTNRALLDKIVILRRSMLNPVPWFRTKRGGGAIVLGSVRRPKIIFTENFFLREIYGRKVRHYGNRLDVWLDMLSHEIGHVEQLGRIGHPARYVFSFAWQYLSTFSHRQAPLEKEAEEGRRKYRMFVRRLREQSLMKEYYTLLRSELPDEEKIRKIDIWLEKYS